MPAANDSRLVVLDRDGVINRESGDFIRTPREWLPLPGSLEAIARLSRAGWLVVVATNQSGVGRGIITAQNLAAIHEDMTRAIENAGGRLAGIFTCPHRPDEGCDCRKPLPGLLRQIEQRWGILLAGRPVIGDSLRDLQAAAAVGALPMLVRTGNGPATEESGQLPEGTRIFADLSAAADWLLAVKDPD